MYKNGDEFSDGELLAAESLYWDSIEEIDDGIPRRYGTIKESVGRKAEPTITVLRGEVRRIEFEPE